MSITFLMMSLLWDLFGPSPPIVVSEDTTVITSPLTKAGLPDFEKFLRDFGRAGVTVENNAAVPFWQAVWPGGLLEEDQLLLSQTLGFEHMPSPNPSRDLLHRDMRKAITAYLTEQYDVVSLMKKKRTLER